MDTLSNLRMIQGRVLIRPEKLEPTTSKGLFLPETISRGVATGVIVAVDEGKLRKGDRVLYQSNQAMEIKLEGDELVVLHESQIIAVFGRLKAKKKVKKS